MCRNRDRRKGLQIQFCDFNVRSCYWWWVLSHAQLFCDPMDWSPPGFSLPGILQARILEWVAISFSRGFSQPRDRIQVSCIVGIFFTTEPQESPNVSSEVKVTPSCPTLCDPVDFPCDSPWNSPDQNIGVGSLSLLQGIFTTQGLNPGLLHCKGLFIS